MTDTRNLSEKEAIEKLRELAKDIKTCIFTTNLEKVPLSARPMHAKEVDELGNMWFFLIRQGDHYKEIVKDNRVQLFFAGTGKAEFLSVYGKAELIDDMDKRKEMWTSMDKTYFTGPEDKNLVIAKVNPEEAYYWDTKSGKAVTLVKMLASGVTGKESDIGVKGNLDV